MGLFTGPLGCAALRASLKSTMGPLSSIQARQNAEGMELHNANYPVEWGARLAHRGRRSDKHLKGYFGGPFPSPPRYSECSAFRQRNAHRLIPMVTLSLTDEGEAMAVG